MPQVVTANRLTDGRVVFLDAHGAWVERLAEAAPFSDKSALEAATKHAEQDVAGNLVVDVFAFEVKVDGATISAITLRDKIRTRGPTVRLDHGKQAAPQASEFDDVSL
jgi:hypothetical protein